MKNGHVLEFENAELENIKKRIARELGYELVGDRLELYGVPIGAGGDDNTRITKEPSLTTWSRCG